ncbi:phage portal protein [Levilactobacillus enshiensis]|uniref:phage portal protein n=1 Tax=Levilactobacillus enshiensis TaxID=2590213 RepID=UPI001179A8C3|nr:phage portal protein [Levilactobacillus enshiensis]
MAYKIDATLLDDIDNPPASLLNNLIDLKQQDIGRLNKMRDYYLGKHAIFDRMLSNPGSKDNKVMVNHAKYITDMVTGMMTGNPITYVTQDGKSIDAITEAFDRMNITAHDTELERDLSCYGVAYEMNYLTAIDDETTEERIALLDPRNTFVVTDDSEDENVLFGVYMLPKRKLDGTENGYLVSVYTKHSLIQYRTVSGSRLSETNMQTGFPKVSFQYWGEEPITEYKNNEQMQGDFEQLISQIDSYNNLQSDRIADKDAFVDAILLVYGTTIEGKLEKGQMLDGLAPKDEGTSVEWLTKTLDENATQTLADSITNDIHEMSNVPNMNDKDFAGNISGEAMKYKLFGLLNLISVKEQSLKEGLKRRLKLMQNMLKIKEQDVDVSSVKVRITPNIPVNMTDTITNIKNADGVIPRLVSYSWLPDGYDPQKLIDLMKQQNDEQIANQKKAMGSDESDGNVDDDRRGFRDDSGDNNQEPTS